MSDVCHQTPGLWRRFETSPPHTSKIIGAMGERGEAQETLMICEIFQCGSSKQHCRHGYFDNNLSRNRSGHAVTGQSLLNPNVLCEQIGNVEYKANSISAVLHGSMQLGKRFIKLNMELQACMPIIRFWIKSLNQSK